MIQVKEVSLSILGFPKINHPCANHLFACLNIYITNKLILVTNVTYSRLDVSLPKR